jgi:hypothetical protein
MDSYTYPDGDVFKTAISEVLDIPSMLDKMIMISLCGMPDQEARTRCSERMTEQSGLPQCMIWILVSGLIPPRLLRALSTVP